MQAGPAQRDSNNLMRYKTLGNTGLQVSWFGFGGATLGNEYGLADETELTRAVHLAIDEGINVIDVAPYYGRTLAEKRLGEALKGRRDKMLISTKCARYDFAEFDFSAERVTRSIDESLQRLRTDYVDIFHIHDIEFADRVQVIEETVPALRKIQQSGKARLIGITGLQLEALRAVAEAAPVDCILSYCRYSLLNQDLNEVLAPFTSARGIGLFSASPLHMRLLSEQGPPAWHPAPDSVRIAAREVVDLCKRRGVRVTDIGLQFAVRNPDVACTFNGLCTQEEVRQNLRAIEEEPDPELLAEIATITAGVKGIVWDSGKPENWDRYVEHAHHA